jgi:hypothetical protein
MEKHNPMDTLIGIILIIILMTGTVVLGHSVSKYSEAVVDETMDIQVWAVECSDQEGSFVAEYAAEERAPISYEKEFCSHLSSLR